MHSLKLSTPTHLSVFVTDPNTGQPVAHIPLYAEVAVPRITPILPIDEHLREPIAGALDSNFPTPMHNQIVEIALQALGQTITKESQTRLINEPDMLYELFRLVFEAVLATTGQQDLGNIPLAELKSLIIAMLRRIAPEMDLNLVPEVEDTGIIWADPLGVLTTDHAGYASFDLKRLRPEVQVLLAEAIDMRRNSPNAIPKLAIWVYPYGYAEKFEVLSQARFAFDAVVARLPLQWNALTPALINMGMRALQNPSLTDWRLSPTSFAASPKSLVGENGCEELLPANLALQEFVLRQVVRVTKPPANVEIPTGYKFAYVDDYKVSWFSLGHSLGEILYSLPLAPAESVKLAVIDWSWDSLTKRDEQTHLTEEVLHQTHRDRTITETVKAGLKEFQHGSSFMGGTASAAGASGGANLGVVGLGAAVGNTWSLGGSTATSDGSRDLAAENVQRLSDSFSQASSAQRELNSTVVIQARQEEKESIQTRTFTNYNHSHTLTILYYEVLRHFRITVEWVRRRHAVLVQLPKRIDTFDAATLINHRLVLEGALLDQTLKGAFDALEKQEAIRGQQARDKIDPNKVLPAPFWNGNVEFTMFEIGLWSRDHTTSPVTAYIITSNQDLGKKIELRYVYKGTHIGGRYEAHNLSKGDRFNHDWEQWTFVKPFDVDAGKFVSVKWKDIAGFQFEKWGDDNWRIDALTINAFGGESPTEPKSNFTGWVEYLVDFKRDVDLYFPGDEPSSQTFSAIKRPEPPPAPFPAILSPERSLSSEEYYQIKKLEKHFEHHKDYYNRAILLATDSATIAIQFENEVWAGTEKLMDHADPNPLEVFGSYVAYPLATQPKTDDTLVVDIAAALNGNDPARRQWAQDRLAALNEGEREQILERVSLASAKSERLITLPTRGVFAEGKLGHCNVSEEIDNTRFWKWEEHPIPIEAPGINPVTPIQPQPQQVSATPTAFPQSLVNIVNPSPAPDPAGLGAALSLLATPNIFRDMSGRQEVADLLKKLSDNSIAIAEAATKAREIQAKYGTELDKQQKEYDLGAIKTNAELEKGKLALEQERARQVTPSEAQDTIKLSESELRKGNKTPEEHKQLSKTVQNNQKGVQPATPQPKRKKIQFDLKGWGDTHIVGQWRLDLDQRGTAVGFIIETATNASGKIIIEVPNEFNDHRYSLSIAGEVLAGFGINSILKVQNLLVEFPPEKYKANDYLYVVLRATTDKFHTKASDSDEVTRKFSEHFGVSPEVGYKNIIKVTGEGGWTWEREGKKVAGHEMEMDVYYYTGGFTVESMA